MTAPADKKDCPLCKHFNVSIHENNAPADDLDTLVRDLTRTTPLPKSEVRARIKKYTEDRIVAELENLSLDVIEPCEPDCTPERHARHEGSWQTHIAIDDRIKEIKDEGLTQ